MNKLIVTYARCTHQVFSTLHRAIKCKNLDIYVIRPVSQYIVVISNIDKELSIGELVKKYTLNYGMWHQKSTTIRQRKKGCGHATALCCKKRDNLRLLFNI